MTYKNDFTLPSEVIDLISQQGFEFLPELIRLVIDAALYSERQQYLQAAPYQRTPERETYANGYKPKTVNTRVGPITFSIPQVRDSGFYPHALEKGLRSERALTMTLAEMYVMGVSTRKVKEITEQLCGIEVSAAQVSRDTTQLDSALQEWRERPLGEIKYLYLYAIYEKVRENGQIRDAAVLIATGLAPNGVRSVLGVSVSLSEQEEHWKELLRNLKDRGMNGVKLVISDAHAGLGAARRSMLGSVPWQRCQFHLRQNAQAYIPRQSMKAEVAADIRSVFNASDHQSAETTLQTIVNKYTKSAPRLSAWMEENLPDGFTVFDFPLEHQRSIRTSNSVERVNKEIRRRTKVVWVFPNEESCLRLISALLVEISEDWEIGRRCCANVTSTNKDI